MRFFLRASGPVIVSLIAQGLTLVASLLPILFQLTEPLVFVVLVSSIATVIAQPASISAANRLPAIGGRLGALRFGGASVVLIASVAVVGLCLAGVLYALGERRWASIAAGAALLSAAQALYLVSFAECIRRLDHRATATTRFVYGVTAFALTLVACAAAPSGPAIVAAYAIAYLAAALSVVSRLNGRQTLIAVLRSATPRALRLEMAENWRYVAAASLSNISSQAPGLALPQLGLLASPWSIATRIGSGFQTIGASVAGPPIDIRVSEALQRGASHTLRKTFIVALVVGVGLAIFAVAVIFAAIYWTHSEAMALLPTTFVVSIFLFWGASILIAVCGRTLSLLGKGRAQLWLEIGKVTIILPCLLFLNGSTLLITVSAATTLALLVYVALTFCAIGSFRDDRNVPTTLT
jgi:hypothetical protein